MRDLAMNFNEMAANLERSNVERTREVENRRETEQVLAEARERVNAHHDLILDAAADGIYGIDQDGLTTFVNPAAAKMLGWEREGLLGVSGHDAIHHSRSDGTLYPVEECPIRAGLQDGRVRTIDPDIFIRRDGTSFLVEYTSATINVQGENRGTVVLFKDVTERSQNEERMHVSLLEKEALLKEIHHRVNNNLQLISSLLSLQADQIDDPVSAHLFRDSQHRVKSMALIHEALYRSPDLGASSSAATRAHWRTTS